MNKSAFLAAASVIGLSAGSAAATGLPMASFSGEPSPFPVPKGAPILYNQNSNSGGTSVNSQNYTSGDSSAFNDQGADDFVIPKGKTWRIKEVDVTGEFFNDTGYATSENVIFYKNKNGMPGIPVSQGTFENLDGANSPDFKLVLPGNGLKMKAGHYWVSVIANMNFQSSEQWGWEVNKVQHGYQAMWQNPPGGFRTCTTWGTIESCVSSSAPDSMFDLKERSNGEK